MINDWGKESHGANLWRIHVTKFQISYFYDNQVELFGRRLKWKYWESDEKASKLLAHCLKQVGWDSKIRTYYFSQFYKQFYKFDMVNQQQMNNVDTILYNNKILQA